jgi:sporulation integral membrane protein YlbJ
MSILSGYPVGAKLTADIYKSNKINSAQAQTISSFTSTSGPLFIIGTVGIGFFNNQKIGIIVLISHLISALLNGLIYRNKKENKVSTLTFSQSNNILNESMTNSIQSIMVVGGFIAIFYMILNILLSINAFDLPLIMLEKIGINYNIGTSIISGLIEVTTGALKLSECGLNIKTSCTILSFLISFGGLSIHAQAYCFLKDFGMSYGKFLIQKVTHAILSTLVTLIILLFI